MNIIPTQIQLPTGNLIVLINDEILGYPIGYRGASGEDRMVLLTPAGKRKFVDTKTWWDALTYWTEKDNEPAT